MAFYFLLSKVEMSIAHHPATTRTETGQPGGHHVPALLQPFSIVTSTQGLLSPLTLHMTCVS